MRYHRSAGILLSDPRNTARREFHVHITIPLPEIHLAPGALGYPRPEVLIRNKKNVPISWRSTNDPLRVAACADHVGKCFHAGAAVDVSDDVIIPVRVLLKKLFKLVRWARFRKRAARFQIREDHSFARVYDFRGLRHEMDPAEQNDVSISLGRLIAQTQ